MGVCVLPKMVIETFPNRKLFATHAMPKEFSRAPTVLIWRRGTHSPKVAALVEALATAGGAGTKTRRQTRRREARFSS
jgi:DNA-binding transcriptional LysR family regulator